jgi:sterol desaturase/sphingolipid hydroxylase (fatty acid hydroxylase superfamily)/creatinine amidohydrolase/Fe(II)-dependent formamide hydrolase-like protein
MFQDKALPEWLVVFDPQQRIYVLYLATSLILAFLAYWTMKRGEAKEAGLPVTGGFFKFMFSRDIYGHRSALQDYAIAALNLVIVYVFVAQFMIGSAFFATTFSQMLVTAFGTLKAPLLHGPWATIAYTLAALIIGDFALWLQHILMHKTPVLWHFHKVHHSAEVLTPMTTFRLHPVDIAFSSITASLFAGLAYGLFWYLTKQDPHDYLVLGLNIGIFLFYLCGYNLRHSHVWLAYPRWISHILVSPAQHQIHHSTAPQHFDRNMGFVVALWDWLFGTLVVPKGREQLQYGISRAEPNPFRSTGEIYLSPFKWAWRSLRQKKERDSFISLLLVMGVIGVMFFMLHQAIDARSPPSVKIEDLTWVEIRDAMARGYDTVIIPTGGTEQNGAHEVIGKHNYIVAYTAEQIARTIGGALVAPVLSYAPEGPVEGHGHMMFPGTLTVPEAAFEAVLRSAAESYIHHGFKHIFFIGDHGDSQEPQAIVAAALTKQWAGKGVTIVQVADYYAANGQKDWLLSHGYTAKQIGGHAGIRDTSELLAIRPEGIRRHPPGHPDAYGNSGDYRLATKAIGQKMLQLKIDAAAAQMRPYLKDRETAEQPKN